MVRWHLNRFRLSRLVALLAFLILLVGRPFATERTYSDNSIVPGYTGWVSLPFIGVIAFRRDDGTLQYRW